MTEPTYTAADLDSARQQGRDEMAAQIAALRAVIMPALSEAGVRAIEHGSPLHRALTETAAAALAFVEKIRREEREACAQIAEEFPATRVLLKAQLEDWEACVTEVAAAIRARAAREESK